MSAEHMEQRAPIVDKVLNDIRESIFLNKFEPEQSLTENTLAQMYGVSRGSVRTAIQVLETEGLIVIGKTGRKTPVRITEKFTQDLYSTRIMLESQAIRICIANPAVDSSIIAAAFADFYKLYSYSGDELYIQRSRINTDFHKSIIRMAGNISLSKCWDTLEPMIYCMAKFNYINLGDKQSNEALIQSHQQLMDLILKRDARALQVIEDHIALAEHETSWGLQEK